MSEKPFVSFPEYPFEDFSRDFDAINAEVNASEEGDFMDYMMILREYMQKAYPDQKIRIVRAGAVGMCLTFIADHIKNLDFGPFAVHGRNASMFSEPVFRAAYEVAGGFALDTRRPEPSVKEFIRRAAVYAKEEQTGQPVGTDNGHNQSPPSAESGAGRV